MPGATALTRTPRGPPWTAAVRARLATAALDTVYGTRSELPRSLAIDAVSTIAPPPSCCSNWRNAARSPRNAPRTLTFITASNSSISMSGYGASVPPMPAFRW